MYLILVVAVVLEQAFGDGNYSVAAPPGTYSKPRGTCKWVKDHVEGCTCLPGLGLFYNLNLDGTALRFVICTAECKSDSDCPKPEKASGMPTFCAPARACLISCNTTPHRCPDTTDCLITKIDRNNPKNKVPTCEYAV